MQHDNIMTKYSENVWLFSRVLVSGQKCVYRQETSDTTGPLPPSTVWCQTITLRRLSQVYTLGKQICNEAIWNHPATLMSCSSNKTNPNRTGIHTCYIWFEAWTKNIYRSMSRSKLFIVDVFTRLPIKIVQHKAQEHQITVIVLKLRLVLHNKKLDKMFNVINLHCTLLSKESSLLDWNMHVKMNINSFFIT